MTKKSNRFGAFAAMFATAVMCACEAWAYAGKNKVTSDLTDVDLGMGGTTPACIWQPGFNVTANVAGGNQSSVWGVTDPPISAAYLLDGGTLRFNTECYIRAPYLHYRQRGGVCNMGWSGFRVENSYHTEYTFRGDFVYSGDAVASGGNFAYFTMPFCISVSDNANVSLSWINEDNGKWTNENIIAINGGRINANTYGRASRCVYFYNGGELYTSYGGASASYGTNAANAVVRVCERGGSFCIAARTTELASYLEPIGNVVKMVELTDAVKEMVWPMPPAVVITGSGSNAFAVADWDFDTGHVTNITVLCCGEGYTEGTTKANFAYKKGDELLETPLDCTLGTVRADGDFTFAEESGSGDVAYFQAKATTNEWRGATIIDTDRNHKITHDVALTTSEYGHSLAIYRGSGAYFPHSTNIIIKSGELIAATGSINEAFPSCTRFEAYSGHLARSTHRFKDVVIGGELWLCCISKTHGYTSVLNVTNTLWVAPGASVTNGVVVTPKVKYGTFTIGNDAKVVIQDWSKLPKGKKIVALDLSEVGTLNHKSGGPVLEQSNEGILEWNDTEKKLYARRHSDGMMLIFR